MTKYIPLTFVYTLIIAAILIGVYSLLTNNDNPELSDNEPGPAVSETTTFTDSSETDDNNEVNETSPNSTAEVDAEADLEVETDLVGETKVFEVSGVNFAFDVKEIRVNEGDTVTINFESTEGFHDWVVDEFDVATAQVRPGTPTSVTFVADKAGTYEYYCSVGSHRQAGMVGTLIVE